MGWDLVNQQFAKMAIEIVEELFRMMIFRSKLLVYQRLGFVILQIFVKYFWWFKQIQCHLLAINGMG